MALLFGRTLIRHPTGAGPSGPSVGSVRAEVFRQGPMLRLAFEFVGGLEHLDLPAAPLDPAKLWEHTCAELFVADHDGRYMEWNLSPTRQATRFEFSSYRERTSASFDEVVAVSLQRLEDRVRIVADGPLLRGFESVERASLCAVVRTPQAQCSYWALSHPRPEPDFHDPRGFVLDGALLTERVPDQR